MPINLSTIKRPPRRDWLSFRPINATDPGGVFESAHFSFAVSGPHAQAFPGPFETASLTFTKGSDVGPSLAECSTFATFRRESAGGVRRIDLRFWGYNVELQAAFYRVNSTGSQTLLSTRTVSIVGATLSPAYIVEVLPSADTRPGGVDLPIFVDLSYRRIGEETFEAHIEHLLLVHQVLNSPIYGWSGFRLFGTAGATGRFGPGQIDIDESYEATTLEGEVTQFGDGQQLWTIPVSGTYRISCAGAEGGIGTGATIGGRGAILTADFDLVGGQSLLIGVGQRGTGFEVRASGGGASWVVVQETVQLLMVAGGGGGHRIGSEGTRQSVCDASATSTSGKNAFGGTSAGTGGTAGEGGAGASSRGAGGGGYFDAGSPTPRGGFNLDGGGVGGDSGGSLEDGGFGGGGSVYQTTSWGAAGGGGGYSGGGGAYASSGGTAAGGGGGSFIISSASVALRADGADGNLGDGFVRIEFIGE